MRNDVLVRGRGDGERGAALHLCGARAVESAAGPCHVCRDAQRPAATEDPATDCETHSTQRRTVEVGRSAGHLGRACDSIAAVDVRSTATEGDVPGAVDLRGSIQCASSTTGEREGRPAGRGKYAAARAAASEVQRAAADREGSVVVDVDVDVDDPGAGQTCYCAEVVELRHGAAECIAEQAVTRDGERSGGIVPDRRAASRSDGPVVPRCGTGIDQSVRNDVLGANPGNGQRAGGVDRRHARPIHRPAAPNERTIDIDIPRAR